MALASAAGELLAAIATDRISLVSTLMLLIDVLLLPLMVIVLVRGAGMRGKLKGILAATAGGGGLGSTSVAWQAPSAGGGAPPSAAPF